MHQFALRTDASYIADHDINDERNLISPSHEIKIRNSFWWVNGTVSKHSRIYTVTVLNKPRKPCAVICPFTRQCAEKKFITMDRWRSKLFFWEYITQHCLQLLTWGLPIGHWYALTNRPPSDQRLQIMYKLSAHCYVLSWRTGYGRTRSITINYCFRCIAMW